MIGKRCPDKISNAKLYWYCKTYPISLRTTELRWQKFGHILKLDQNTPAYTSMLYYFLASSIGLYKGVDRTTIVTTINRDINRVKTFSNEIYTICQFFRKHSDALGLCTWYTIFHEHCCIQRKSAKTEKTYYLCCQADKTYVNMLWMRIGYYYYFPDYQTFFNASEFYGDLWVLSGSVY